MKGNVGSASSPSDSFTLIMIQFFEAAEVGGMTRDDKRLLGMIHFVQQRIFCCWINFCVRVQESKVQS